MNDIHVYSTQTYEKQISHNYYCQDGDNQDGYGVVRKV
jgi:hypothetical protein